MGGGTLAGCTAAGVGGSDDVGGIGVGVGTGGGVSAQAIAATTASAHSSAAMRRVALRGRRMSGWECGACNSYPSLNLARNSIGPNRENRNIEPPTAIATIQGPTTDSHGAASAAQRLVKGSQSPTISSHGSGC